MKFFSVLFFILISFVKSQQIDMTQNRGYVDGYLITNMKGFPKQLITKHYSYDFELNNIITDTIVYIDYFDSNKRHIKSVTIGDIIIEKNFVYNQKNEIESFVFGNLTEYFKYDKKGRIKESNIKSTKNSTVDSRFYFYNDVENKVEIKSYKNDSLLYISQKEYERNNDSLSIKNFELVNGIKFPTSEQIFNKQNLLIKIKYFGNNGEIFKLSKYSYNDNLDVEKIEVKTFRNNQIVLNEILEYKYEYDEFLNIIKKEFWSNGLMVELTIYEIEYY